MRLGGIGVITRQLQNGATGSDVAEWQQDLNSSGAQPSLVIDGQFGPATLAATQTFQQAQGLTVDGIVGPNTLSAMASVLSSPGAVGQSAGGGDNTILYVVAVVGALVVIGGAVFSLRRRKK